MFGTHLWLFGADGETPTLVAAIEGKAAALFATLAGVGIALTTRRSLERGDAAAARRSLVGRGAALVAIGFTLGLLPEFVLVILAFYGVTFWLAIPLVRWRPWVLLAVAAVWAIAWPIASHALRAALEADERFASSPSWFSLLDPLDLLGSLLVWGAYPALAWIVYVAVGMAIGMLVLRVRADGASLARLGGVFAAIGAGAALVVLGVNELLVAALAPRDRASLRENAYGVTSTDEWSNLLSTGPHTSTPFDLLITTGTSVAVIGACLALGAVLARPARRILLPVLGAGGAPLTVYALHVVAASLTWAAGSRALATSTEPPWFLSSPQLWALHLAVALAIGLVLRLLGQRGPLEWLVTWAGRLAARMHAPSRSS